MLKDIPQDFVTIWQQRVSIIPEGIYEMLRIGAFCQRHIERARDHAAFPSKH